jgi:hypothetical protein
MSREPGSPIDGENRDASIDAELARVLEAYLAGLEAGRPVDPERLIAEHPSLADQLRSCLAVVNLADRVADRPGSTSAIDGTMPRSGTGTSPPGRSALTTLGLGGDGSSQVQLRDLPDDCEPVVNPRLDLMPALSEAGFGRYQLQGEIARGGMGAVLKGRDVDLGRDLAIKVLLEAHRGNAEVVRRFVEEAQIGGQLQYPGIVPVYELGAFPDRRPYFAMKLVKGRTLAALLGERQATVGAGSVRRSGTEEGIGAVPAKRSDIDRGTEAPLQGDHVPPLICRVSSPSSSKSARPWPTPTPAA